MLEGFDASGWSGNVDCVAAKAAGKTFAYWRVGRGQPDQATNTAGIDLKWATNKYNSINAGLKTGGYWRYFPNGMSLDLQVGTFAAALSQLPGMLPPWVDAEDNGGLSAAQLTDKVIEFCEKLEAKCGRRPIIYTGKNFYDTKLEYWRLDKWELAIAWQTTGTWREYGSVFWQYLLDTPVPWSTGRVDLQRFALNSLDIHTKQTELLYHFDADGMLHGPLVYSDKLLPESGKQGTQTNYMSIVHTMVGYLNGTDSYFRRADIGLESTFGVGGKYDPIDLDGAIYQWMKAWEKADAQSDANAYAISIETSDGGGERYKELWSAKQAESIAQIDAAWCLYANQPAQLVARAHSSLRGFGYHRQGIDPYRGPNDDRWSPDGGKVCPGFERSTQYINDVIPRVQRILASVKNGGGAVVVPPPPVDELEEVFGMSALDSVISRENHDAVTVRDALMGGYYAGQVASETDEKLRAMEDRLMRVSNRDFTRVLGITGQLTWDQASSLTWDQLSQFRWDQLRKIDD